MGQRREVDFGIAQGGAKFDAGAGADTETALLEGE